MKEPALPTISACMIIKNEEDCIKRCLDSIEHFVDEIIIVDTGSTDKTMEIASKYDKVKLYEHAWMDDFSLHRNQSIQYATGDWLFIFDADEELIVHEKYPLKSFKKDLSELPDTVNAVKITARDIQEGRTVMTFDAARYFKKGHIHYEGIVHNNAIISENSAAPVHPSISYNHYGYDMTPEKKEKKQRRVFRLLNKSLEANPKDYVLHFYLSQAHHLAEDFEKSVEAAETYYGHRKVLGDQFNKTVFFTTFRSYVHLGNKEKAGEWLYNGLKDIPGDLDLALATVEYGNLMEDSLTVVRGANAYVKAYDAITRDPASKGRRFVFSYNVVSLAYCLRCLSLVNLQDGIHALKNLAVLVPILNDAESTSLVAEVTNILTTLGVPNLAEVLSEKKVSEVTARNDQFKITMPIKK